MNDWPADPKLDASLRGLVSSELAAARADAVGLRPRAVSPHTSTHRGGYAVAFAGLGALAVIAVVASLALRGATPGGSLAGAGGATGSAASPNASPKASQPTASRPSPSLPPSAAPTAAPTATSAKLSLGFSQTGSLKIRDDWPLGDQSVLLGDGRVLIVHRCDTTAELYDPKTGEFTLAGPMTATRLDQTATLLKDGRVLITGGYNCGDAEHQAVLASAEVYDPRTGKFSKTGSMSEPRELQTATLLQDGRVLIAGGYGAYDSNGGVGVVSSAELYEPKTGKFSLTGSLTSPRERHTATLLRDGRVLLVGGDGLLLPVLATAELYDPKTGTFSQTGSMAAGRIIHTATLLQDGRVLVTGGLKQEEDETLASAEVYDPGSGEFSSAGSMSSNREEHTATLLNDGRVLIAGGYNGVEAVSSTELYDPRTGKLTPNGSMGDARAGHTATLLKDGRVLIAGGSYLGANGGMGLTSAVLFTP